MTRYFSILALSVLCMSSSAQDWIEIKQKSSGRSLPVQVIALDDESITFKIKSGKEFTRPLTTLTDDSIEKAKEFFELKQSANKQHLEKINKAIGQELLNSSGSLWSQPAEDIAAQLKWPRESSSSQSSSYRYYPPKDYTFLGTHPYSAVLYGDAEGNTSHLSLVFANKGDYGSSAGMGEDHFKKVHPEFEPATSLEKAIELDAKIINKTLTEALGEPTKQYFGEKEDKRRVLRWDFDNQSFILSEKDSEYTSVLIIPKETADAEGKVKFVKDADLKKIVTANVLKKDNKDTIIQNIPMVDQGPKGYCAPATFERAMRYMLVPADMYLLATLATEPEGGTNTQLLADSCKRIIRSKARRIKDLDLERDLKVRKIKKFIDKGVPILWCMRSLESYNKIANTRTKERANVSDFEEWSKVIDEEAQQVKESLENTHSNYHICLIIGYNEETNEIAVSDSWGPRYELRWVHIDVAKAVTSRGGFVIDL